MLMRLVWCNKSAPISAGLRWEVVGMIGGHPARAFESTCRPGDEVRGSCKVALSCGLPAVAVMLEKETRERRGYVLGECEDWQCVCVW